MALMACINEIMQTFHFTKSSVGRRIYGKFVQSGLWLSQKYSPNFEAEIQYYRKEK